MPKKYTIQDLCFNLKSYNNLDGTTTIYGNCIVTGNLYECNISTYELNIWLENGGIKNCMPTVSEYNRHFILSGISPNGWKGWIKN